MTPDERAVTARRFARAGALGAAVATAVFLWLAAAGTGDLGRASGISGLYELQARSLLEGRWDVPARAAWIEGIRIDGRTYLYYGPWPAILRLPAVVLSDRVDGHLTQASTALAFVVLLAAAGRLVWQARTVLRPAAPWTRGEAVGSAVAVAAAGLGTPAVFAASVPIVYHEAELWGAAWALVAYDATVALARRPHPARVAWAGLAAALALFTRASVGMGPIVALGLVGLWFGVRAVGDHRRRRRARRTGLPRTEPGPSPGRWWVRAVAVGAVALLPLVGYAALNTLKFRSKFGLPLDRQRWTEVSPSRRAALAANDWRLFGVKFAPTTVLHYLRPDALSVMALYPFVDFPRRPPPVIGDVVFDTLDVAASLPTTMPLWFPLGAVGGVAIFLPARRRRRRARGLVGAVGQLGLAPFRPPLLGALVGVGPTVTIAFIAHRYLIDFVPLFLVAGAVGFQLLWRWAEATGRGARRVAAAVFALAVLAGAWVNVGLGVVYQRVDFPLQPADRLRLVETQARVGRLPALPDPPVGSGWVPPADAAPHRLQVVGACDALLVRGRGAWYTITRSRRTGETRLLVDVAGPLPPGRRLPLLVARPAVGAEPVTVAWRARRAGDVLTEVRVGDDPWIPGGAVRLRPGRHRVVVGLDSLTAQIVVEVDGWTVVQADRWVPLPAERRPGRAGGVPGVEPRFPGRVLQDRSEPGRAACRGVVGHRPGEARSGTGAAVPSPDGAPRPVQPPGGSSPRRV